MKSTTTMFRTALPKEHTRRESILTRLSLLQAACSIIMAVGRRYPPISSTKRGRHHQSNIVLSCGACKEANRLPDLAFSSHCYPTLSLLLLPAPRLAKTSPEDSFSTLRLTSAFSTLFDDGTTQPLVHAVLPKPKPANTPRIVRGNPRQQNV